MSPSLEPLLPPSGPKENFKEEEKLPRGPTENIKDEEELALGLVFDPEKPCLGLPELRFPTIDLGAFLSGDPRTVAQACAQVSEACKTHGFFLVVNHGVDAELTAQALGLMDRFFGMSANDKQRAQKKGGVCGYFADVSGPSGGCSNKLRWKETLTFIYCAAGEDGEFKRTVEEYIVNVMGEDFRLFGAFYQEYSEVMSKLSLTIMELLGMSLGLGREQFREFFEENESLMRLNYYPSCERPEEALGSRAHKDPISLTILHQDQVGGLQVLLDNQWYSITPNPHAFVINIGDTFVALTNGIYKSCKHRAVVQANSVRKSAAFFLCPGKDKVVTPPTALVNEEHPRRYPDFTWPTFLEFTQRHYTTNTKTLEAFLTWLQHKNN